MSAWDVYWIMQMDSIHIGIVLAMVAGVICSLIALGISCEAESSKAAGFCFFMFLGFLFCLFLCAFIPSTKTLAAMYAVPAIVNNEELKTDLGEVYELGMERLKEVLETETKNDQ